MTNVYTIVTHLPVIVNGFDWDEGNLLKCQGHGVSIAEIEAVFRFGPLLVADPAHSATEERIIAIGGAPEGRPVFLVFTLRERDGVRLVRAISARYMHKEEIDNYAQALSGTDL